MPIEVNARIEPFDQEQFHALDKKIMAQVFEIHNELGRLLQEDLYLTELAEHCRLIGMLPIEREVRIRVTHDTFVKDYFIDVLFCHGLIFEGKVVEHLGPIHRSQCLNYLMLAGLQHGRLVNFRTAKVQYEFVSTKLTTERRHRFRVVDKGWQEMSAASRNLKTRTLALLSDWGAFLDIGLYREALIHFMGGPDEVWKMVEIVNGNRQLGAQKLTMLSPDVAFALTMKSRGSDSMRSHLERLLNHSRLQAIQWINLNRHLIEFSTLARSKA